MAYVCPICGHPQADAEHLANHLAITAIARGGEHEAWLNETVPSWETMTEAELAGAIQGDVEERSVTDPATDALASGLEGSQGSEPRSTPRPGNADRTTVAGSDDVTRAAIETARELTRRRRSEFETDSTDEG